ncbi:ThuA domain-containing protein [uncultured Erythrobacter sp.]|uniref:ThuA domain-containing protein n=1 Tax=uncultured Erythrobacter sp. TaxID=263913 RepID=UPI0026158501|nr:ThuA domain-containing protein [uncultured Erythrobacter sp.]
MSKSLLVLSGGHPYEAEPFEQLIHSLGDWDVTHLVHPEAEEAVGEGAAKDADALLFYDMGGYIFADDWVTSRPPSEAYRRAIIDRFASGRGAVAMHHALAGWADWPEWHDMLGGRFLYTPGKVRGAPSPDSGYRHDVDYTAQVVADHPVTAGLPAEFPMCDELYLAHVFEDDVTPLIRSSHTFTRDNFYSATLAISGTLYSNEGWEHPDGSNLVAWHKQVGAAPLVYLQFGDTPETYANPHMRKALSNALHFIAGETP